MVAIAGCDPVGWIPVPAPPAVAPEVEVSVRIVEYPVQGTTEAEWRASIDDVVRVTFPKRPDGQPYGLTKSDLTYDHEPRPHPTGCVLADLRVRLDVVEFVPVQAPEGFLGTSPSYLDFARHIRSHEDGHKDIDVRWAHALAEDLAALPAQPTCDALEEAMNAAWSSALADRNAAHAAYHEGDFGLHHR